MREFKIEIARDGRWWMVHIPEIDGLTQARRLHEAETMAREYIALDQNIPYDEIKVVTTSIHVTGSDRELLDEATHIKALKAEARQAEARANAAAAELCRTLVRSGVPVRDIASLLDISPQRVSQITTENEVVIGAAESPRSGERTKPALPKSDSRRHDKRLTSRITHV